MVHKKAVVILQANELHFWVTLNKLLHGGDDKLTLGGGTEADA